jgi:hypothetical protein
MSEDAHRPNISPAIRAAIAKPLKFYLQSLVAGSIARLIGRRARIDAANLPR